MLTKRKWKWQRDWEQGSSEQRKKDTKKEGKERASEPCWFEPSSFEIFQFAN